MTAIREPVIDPTRSPSSELNVCRTGNGVWVSLAGDVDATERDRVIEALDQYGTVSMVSIEMSRLDFLSSAGLSALIHACRKLEPTGHKVVLLDAPPSVVRLLATCGLTDRFTLRLT